MAELSRIRQIHLFRPGLEIKSPVIPVCFGFGLAFRRVSPEALPALPTQEGQPVVPLQLAEKKGAALLLLT